MRSTAQRNQQQSFQKKPSENHSFHSVSNTK